MKPKRSKSKMILLALSALFIIAVTVMVAKPLTQFVSNPEQFRLWVAQRGAAGVLAFMGMNIVQVLLAIIPGGPFEIAAGYAFGTWKGAVLCDISMTAASVIIFLLVRRYGFRFIEFFVEKETITSLGFLRTTPKSIGFLLLFYLLPGMPKDLMSYAVGLTDMPLWLFAVINLAGRFPAIWLSASSGSALGLRNYEIALGMFIIIAVLYLAGLLLWRRRKK